MESSTPGSETTPSLALALNEKQAIDGHPLRRGLSRLFLRPQVEPLICAPTIDQRRYERIVIPHVVAYLGSAHASRPHQVANISVGGFCMLTKDQWTHGSEMPITLQREEWDGEESPECISVQAIVTRRGEGEVGFSIALTSEELIAFSVDSASGCWISKSRMEEFLEKLQKPKGQRLFLFDRTRQGPLALPERTERLLQIAGLRSLAPAPQLWFTQLDLSAPAPPDKPQQEKKKRKPRKSRSSRKARKPAEQSATVLTSR